MQGSGVPLETGVFQIRGFRGDLGGLGRGHLFELDYCWLDSVLEEAGLEVFQLVESLLECLYLLFLLTDHQLHTLSTGVQLETELEVGATGALDLVEIVKESLEVVLLGLAGEAE